MKAPPSPGGPSAHGSDEAYEAERGRVVVSRHSKSWEPRRPAAQGARQHPGSAIEWDGSTWEVVSVQRDPTGYRYTLEPWPPEQVMRRVDTYDEASEARRAASRLSDQRRERGRQRINALSLLYGHLPGDVQEEMHLEYGTSLTTPTILSAVPFFVVGFVSLIILLAGAFGAGFSLPVGMLLLGVYFLAESLIRIMMSMRTGVAVGSLAGIVAYEIWSRMNRAGAPRRRPRMLATSVATAVDPSRLDRDRLLLLEPLLTLLPEQEQLSIEERSGFDLGSTGKRVAIILMVLILVTIAGQFYSMSNSGASGVRLLFLAFNVYLFLEQIVRITTYAGGEIRGSILGFLLLPLIRRML